MSSAVLLTDIDAFTLQRPSMDNSMCRDPSLSATKITKDY